MRSFLLVLDPARGTEFDLEPLFDTYESYESAPNLHVAPSSEVADLSIPWEDFDQLVILFEDPGHEESDEIRLINSLYYEAGEKSQGSTVRLHRLNEHGNWTVQDLLLSEARNTLALRARMGEEWQAVSRIPSESPM